MEADVWLSPAFPFDTLGKLEGKIAYPLKSFSEGIASTLYISNLDAMQNLITFSEECFRENPLSTDVTILGSFYRRFPEKFENLPTLPKDAQILRTSTNSDLSALLSSNYEKYGGVFDASTLGIHYTGIDPRNNWGFRTLFKTPDAPMDLTLTHFGISDNLPLLESKCFSSAIYSLHIHSKDERFFDTSSYVIRMIKISSFNQNEVRNEFGGMRSLLILGETFIIKLLLRVRNSVRSLN